MQITLPDIRDPNLRLFLQLLRQREIHDIVVVGGAVRDTLLGRLCRDIDIAVKLSVEAPKALLEPSANDTYRIVPALEDGLRPLSLALGCNVSSFYERLSFGETMIDVLGLVPLRDVAGQEFPDLFVDCNRRVFNARPELSVAQLVMDSNGKIWPMSGVRDIRRCVARLIKAPLPIHLRQIIRALRTCEELDLTLTSNSAEEIITHVQRLREPIQFKEEVEEEDTRQLINALLEEMPNQSHAGDDRSILTKIVSLVRKHANSSVPSLRYGARSLSSLGGDDLINGKARRRWHSEG